MVFAVPTLQKKADAYKRAQKRGCLQTQTNATNSCKQKQTPISGSPKGTQDALKREQVRKIKSHPLAKGQ